MRLTHLTARALVIGALTTVAFAAKADDWKITPASICAEGGNYYGTNPTYFFNDNGAFGVTSNTAYLSCPIVRDVRLGTSGLVELKTAVSDFMSTKQVSCTARSLNWSGSLIQQNTQSSGVAFATGYKELVFTLTSSANDGYFNIWCTVEGGVGMGVLAIFSRENGGDGF